MNEPFENLYFTWLCAKVTHIENPTPSLTYWNLFRKLYNMEYVWLVSGDDNRAQDGIELREYFLRESGLDMDPSFEILGCSVFEMLIAFSRRAEFNAGRTPEFWFWKFLENLGLNEVNDASDFSPEEIDEILYGFVWRSYDDHGRGGLFPLDKPFEDQRKVEVWYQFCQWLVDQDWPL